MGEGPPRQQDLQPQRQGEKHNRKRVAFHPFSSAPSDRHELQSAQPSSPTELCSGSGFLASSYLTAIRRIASGSDTTFRESDTLTTLRSGRSNEFRIAASAEL
jgi:hypothetical protein